MKKVVFFLLLLSISLISIPVKAEINVLPWQDPYTLEVKANFEHKEKKEILYDSGIAGHLDAAFYHQLNNTAQIEFRVGIGEDIKGLSLFFERYDDEQKLDATGAIPCILTAEDINEKNLNAWLKLKTNNNPALTIDLAPSSDPPVDQKNEITPFFTNSQTVKTNLFVLDPLSKEPYYRYFAQLTLPARKMRLSILSKNQNEEEVRLSMEDLSLGKISSSMWEKLLRAGNKHLNFPRNPTPGENGQLTAKTCSREGASCELSVLSTTIESMYLASVLSRDDTADLLKVLTSITEYHDKTDTQQYIFVLLSFERKVKSLSESISSLAITRLLDQSNRILNRFIDGAPGESPEYTPSDPSDRVNWYVDSATLSTTPDGSPEDPYPTISAALEAAEAGAVLGLNLYVYNGVYREPLVITRDTELNAMPGENPVISATVMNDTPARLAINGFSLIGAEGYGAVNVWNDDAITLLQNVTIEEAEGFGIFQHGGELWLTDVRIRESQALSGVYWLGSGVIVTGGCVAIFNNVVSEDNESSGIVVDDDGTYLWASNLEVNRNHINRYWEEEIVALSGALSSGLGALVIQYGALATLQHLSMTDNEFESIIVWEDAWAEITDLTIRRTREYEPSIPWPDISYGGGIGVRSTVNGAVEITDFLITQNDLAGLVLGRGGVIDLHDGEISENPIGAGVFTEGFDIHRFMDRVIWRDNDRNIDSDTLYLPDLTPPEF